MFLALSVGLAFSLVLLLLFLNTKVGQPSVVVLDLKKFLHV